MQLRKMRWGWEGQCWIHAVETPERMLGLQVLSTCRGWKYASMLPIPDIKGRGPRQCFKVWGTSIEGLSDGRARQNDGVQGANTTLRCQSIRSRWRREVNADGVVVMDEEEVRERMHRTQRRAVHDGDGWVAMPLRSRGKVASRSQVALKVDDEDRMKTLCRRMAQQRLCVQQSHWCTRDDDVDAMTK